MPLCLRPIHQPLTPLRQQARPQSPVHRWSRITRIAARNDHSSNHEHVTDVSIQSSRRGVLKLVGVGLAATWCPHCQALAANTWGYDESTGPSHWPPACQAGLLQSPINIPLAQLKNSTRGPELQDNTTATTPLASETKASTIIFNYKRSQPTELLLLDNGGLQVKLPAGNTCTVNGMELELKQFHFHTPSEHALDGRRTAMEVHLVHENKATGGHAVVGVMMERGGAIANSCLKYALQHAPTAPGLVGCSRPVTLMDLVPEAHSGHRPFVHYRGSLTTPPCSEGVDWFVLTDTIKVTDGQVLNFMEFCGRGSGYGQNARPLQQLGSDSGRHLELEDAAA